MHWFHTSQQCCIADLEFQKAVNTNVIGQSMVDHLLTLVAQQLQVSIPLQHGCQAYILQSITQHYYCCAMLLTLVKLLLWLVRICIAGSAATKRLQRRMCSSLIGQNSAWSPSPAGSIWD